MEKDTTAKILIADDELVSRSKLDLLVQSLGYETVLARHGQEAWDFWQAQKMEIVITDWIMPKLDGLDLCRRIRNAGLGTYTYIIIVTAKGSEDIMTGIEAGADDFISKPFARQDIVAKIRAGRRILDFEKELIKTQQRLAGEIEVRKKAQDDLSAHLNRLEDIVQERTQDLSRAKEQLELELRERKKLEQEKDHLAQQLLQAQKMEAVGTLARGIAHDFNNILFNMLGYSEMIQDELPKDSLGANNLKEVLKAIDRAKELVDQILAFSRQSENNRRPIMVGPMLQEVLAQVRQALPLNVTLHEQIRTDGREILADPAEIAQVVQNLCINACQAMQAEGGRLEVALTEAEIGFDNYHPDTKRIPGHYVKLSVRDTGHGIPPAIIPKIFEPYFTTRKPGEGDGMGLAVVHGIVESSGGWVAVASEPGQGAAFDIYFPEIGLHHDIVEAGDDEPVPGGTEHILLIEDENDLVDLLSKMLQRLGYGVSAFAQGEKAIEAFRQEPQKYDLIITDFTMPKMSGAELAQSILAERPETPIILFTGFSDLMTEAQAKAVGIRAYVMKPIIQKELARIIRKVLDETKEV